MRFTLFCVILHFTLQFIIFNLNRVEVKCPKCRFRYDTPVSSGVNEVACVCPRCGMPFTLAVDDGVERAVNQSENDLTQPETPENARVNVSPIPQATGHRQESPAMEGQKQSSQVPPPVTPDSYKRNPYSSDYKRSDHGCLRNCLLVFIVSFVVLVFFVRNCYEDHSYGSDVIDKDEFYDDSTDGNGNNIAEFGPETPPRWLQGTWRVETDHGVVNVTIRGNQIRELMPDGEINRGTFFYKKGSLYCDFGEESFTILRISQKKHIIYYGKQPMVKQ